MTNIDDGIAKLLETTSSGQQMIKAHGPDWTKWPVTTSWFEGLSLIDPQTPPPPPPPPPPTSKIWAWDVQSLALDPNSAPITAQLLRTTVHGWCNAAQACAIRTADTKTYNVTGLGHGIDSSIAVPNGTMSGLTSDRHLMIIDEVTGRTHDMWEAKFNGNGILVSCSGGMSYDTLPVLAYTPKGGSTNASDVPSYPSALTPEDVAGTAEPHTLRCACKLPGPGSVRYPAAPWSQPYPNGTPGNPVLGSMFRLSAKAPPLSSAAGVLQKTVDRYLRLKGFVITDGGSDLSFRSVDYGGGGQGAKAWADVGVTMVTDTKLGNVAGLKSGSEYQMTLIPWNYLELVVPPTA